MEMVDVIKKLQEIAQQEVAPPGREKQVKALKGKVDNPYAVAWSSYNKSKGKESVNIEAIGDVANEGGFKDIDTAKSEKARLYALLKDKKEKYNATMAGQLDYDEEELQDEIQKIERALGISNESKELNTNTMTKEDKKPVKEAITMSADSPEEASMLMQIMKLAGVQQVTPDMIGGEEPSAEPSAEVPAEVPADNDADAEVNHDEEGHDHSNCPVCGDDAVGSNEMGKMRDMISQNDGGEQAEETFANEPDEKVSDVDTLVNVHSGGLNKQKQQVRKEYPGDNPLAAEDKISEQDLANSLRNQYEGFKKSYQEATKVTETKGKDQDKDGDVDSKDYMKSKDIAIKKAMKK